MPSPRRSPTSSPSSTVQQEPISKADLYRIAVDEYRFQVNLNWSRSQYYIALNLVFLAVATGLLKLGSPGRGSWLVVALYAIGATCCGLAFAAGRTQRRYYRHARDHKRKLEDLLELEDLAITTTPGMGGGLNRLGKVTTFNAVILGLVLVADLAGILFTVSDVVSPEESAVRPKPSEPVVTSSVPTNPPTQGSHR